MKLFVGVLAVLVALAHAAPQGSKDGSAQIVSQNTDIQPDGSFNYAYETDNGIKVEDKGTIKQVKQGDADVAVSVQTGSFQYTAPDGQVISLTFTADENGFQPQGAHLPVAPSS
ncbi:cuticle protein CP14.6-like [Armigeres subalbatus]|uniref:cuticle protein CP14.6-like n=1 Tax=Armigeres subalbatus TaxID=124917 RepID=UPI002ED37BB2